jgi:hypothetical protein
LRSQHQAAQLLQNYGLAILFTCIRGTQVTDAAYNNYANLKTRLSDEVVEELGSLMGSAWMISDYISRVVFASLQAISSEAQVTNKVKGRVGCLISWQVKHHSMYLAILPNQGQIIIRN